ncbi:hypothetical protein G3A56_01565 [Rhizobium oryzihabitans]|uniref:Uncharacterized protein n=1 Tax=Rhizobium oryzihabitans TaxID=2267833 RepID=A0A7L5BDE8_9HYPH|nr:hypothetical protein [Rhizobium oryzihabitans]QIB36846.1 hypothetical protein G3A56_01565 [Rhizobium oryzihabitans]
MSNKYRAEQYISISASESGTEIELQMVVDFTVHPGSKATLVDPAEMPLAEVSKVQFFKMSGLKPLPDPVALPDWLEEQFTTGDDFQTWMLTEAGEQHQAALEDHADQRREMMQEDRL